MYKKILGEILMPVKGKKGWDSIKSQWISDSKLRKKGGLGVSILECSEVLRKIQQVCKEFSSVQFSCSVVSDSLQPHGLQHTRLLCPSQIPRAYSISCPSSQSCHPTISSSVVFFFSHLQSFQHQGLFWWVSSSHHVTKVLQLQFQHQSFQWTPRTDLL